MLKKHLAKENIIDFRTDYRLKSLWSLYGKLERKNGDIEKIYDISVSSAPVIITTYQQTFEFHIKLFNFF